MWSKRLGQQAWKSGCEDSRHDMNAGRRNEEGAVWAEFISGGCPQEVDAR